MAEIKKIGELSGKFTRQSNTAGVDLEHGKLPPQAIELEEVVLGALMLEKDAVNEVIDILQPRSFYKDHHQRIFSAIQDLFQRSEPIDILTVTNELKQRGELELIGGAYFVTQLTNRVASSANAEFHARIIAQKFIQRELIRISSEIIRDAYDDTTDVFTLLDKAESNLFSVAEGNIRKNYDSMSSLIREAIEQIENAKQHEGGVVGIPSGFTDLDRITSGWQSSDLIIVAARPAMGKTSFALSLARNAALPPHNKPVAVFSCEMSSLQLVTRLVSSESEIPSDKLRTGNLENYEVEQIHAKITHLAEANIFIDDTPALSVFELRAKARRLKAQHNIELIVVDYLQLMTVGGENRGNREQEISTISRSLKSIAKELNIPIIALSQLSRSVETRGGDRRPQLSDLRESGAIEQDADMVIFLHRPEYYGLTEDEEGNSTLGLANVIIAKHRNGSVGDVPLKFTNHLAKFSDLENSYMGSDDASPFGGLPTSDEFGSVTFSSRMNDGDKGNEAPSEDDEPPF